MTDLRYSFKEFEAALLRGEDLVLKPSGEWRGASIFMRLLPKAYLKRRLCKAFVLFLDLWEREPIYFPHFAGSPMLDGLAAGQTLLSLGFHEGLAQRLVALQYRLEASNRGLSCELATDEEVKRLKGEAAEWKEGQPLFWNKSLSPWDHKQLEVALRYRAFMALLGQAPKLRTSFFEWVIRDRLPADVFIEFPAISDWIKESLLTGRIGTLGGEKLKVQKWVKEGSKMKVVTLPFEGKEQSLLNRQHKVPLRGKMTLTIEEIFQLFKDKPRRFVNVEYFAHGVANWNAQHLGYFIPSESRHQAIDVEQAEWWRQLPPLEIITVEEAKGRYGKWVSGLNWIATAKASREFLNLNYERCHAYFEIAIPSRDGTYAIYEFGKFARLFPYGVVDNMRMFTVTTPATVAYPDENIYHTTRQHVGYAFELNHYEGLLLMEELRLDILRARAGNMVFQIEAENCAYWIQKHLEELLGKERVPNLFRAKLIKSEARGFMGAFFRFVRLLPALYQIKAMAWFHYSFGAWRGQYVIERDGQRVFKSLSRTSFLKDIVVYMPALLHKQLERGYISPNVPYDELDEAIEKPNSTILLHSHLK